MAQSARSVGRQLPIIGTAVLMLTAPATAQERSPLTLGAVVASALEHNRGVASARRQTDVALAEALVARGVYDTRVRTIAGDARQERRVFDATGALANDPISGRSFTYEVGLFRELPGGLLIQPGISLTQTDDPLAAPAPFAQAAASFGVVLPLGYNRGGQLTRSAQRAADLVAAASGHQLRQLVSGYVLEAVSAYWDYRAAHERLEVHRSSEARALRLLEETRILVGAQERPVTDLNQVQANVASKRMNRLVAEQQLHVAQQRLVLVMGLGAGTGTKLPLPHDDFPEITVFGADPATVDRLTALALTHRAEVAVAALHSESARLLHEAAHAAQRPTLDLAVTLGYVGVTTDQDLASVFTPLYRDIPGVNASIQFSYQASVFNREARGRALQRAAVLEQQRIASTDARERIKAAVFVAATALERDVAVLGETEEATRMYRAAVGNEKKKYGLGVATVFDVIMGEDNLTNVLLAGVDGRLSHALSLASLRYETGTLIDGELRFVSATTIP